MKLLTIVGARPQFIKAGIVSLKLKDYASIEEIIVHTGQHFDANMSDVFFEEMQIPKPKYNLEINSLSHGAMTGRMMEAIEKIIIEEKPHYCMVYGDTNSTLAGALAAKKLHVGVIHVEAGLRSFNMAMPEEINRILTDRISDLLFCPTENAIANLTREGFESFPSKIIKNGDVMQDAALHFSQFTSKDVSVPTERYLLVTLHRAENTDDIKKLTAIISALNKLSEKFRIVFPIHPRTAKIIKQHGIPLSFEPVSPAGYLTMLALLKDAALVLTDSGGLQKEAFFFKKYCITLREETEWIELVENGYNFLAGSDGTLIYQLAEKYFGSAIENPLDLYGGGKAASVLCVELAQL